MASDLDAIRFGSVGIGVVNHPRGQPENLFLQFFEDEDGVLVRHAGLHVCRRQRTAAEGVGPCEFLRLEDLLRNNKK